MQTEPITQTDKPKHRGQTKHRKTREETDKTDKLDKTYRQTRQDTTN